MIEITAHVSENGSLSEYKRKEIKTILDQHKGNDIVISIQRKRSKRSHPQNAYFHAVCVPLISQRLIELGFNEAKSLDWTKDFIKYNCLLKEVVSEKTGEVIKSLGRTSALSKSEFMDFISEVQQFAAQKLDLYIPDPNEQLTIC